MNSTSAVFKTQVPDIVVPTLKGGLGNQLFQISAAFALAKRHDGNFGVNFGLPSSRVQGHGPEKYQDNLYSKIPATSEVPEQVYTEQGFSYNPIPFRPRVIIDGYFQSHKYFNDYKEDICNLFTFPDDIKKKVDTAISKIDGPVIGVHIRRGDYKIYSRVHPPCSVEYYDKAIKEFSNDSTFIVCTDDQESFQSEFDTSKFILSNAQSELEDLYLLSQCDGIIICNSTFSWWGAYLGKDKSKIIAPSTWFGPDGPQDFSDVYVDTWTKIDNI